MRKGHYFETGQQRTELVDNQAGRQAYDEGAKKVPRPHKKLTDCVDNPVHYKLQSYCQVNFVALMFVLRVSKCF